MAKKHFRAGTRGSVALVMAGAMMLFAGCSSADEALPEETETVPEQVFRIGGSFSAPGLISGTDPNRVAGVEVDLANALVEYVTADDTEVSVRWQPVVADRVGAIADEQALDLVIGQFSDELLDPALGWVGPYATAQAALLVHQSPAPEDVVDEPVFALKVIDTADKLSDARVCVVEDTIAAQVELPVGEVFFQHSVSECEVGMRSGRFDAIAADDVQLAGLLLDPVRQEAYDLLSWAQFDDEDVDIPEALVTQQQYWIGTSPDQCAVVEEGLRTLMVDGVVADLLSPLAGVEVAELQPILGSDVTTQHCDD